MGLVMNGHSTSKASTDVVLPGNLPEVRPKSLGLSRLRPVPSCCFPPFKTISLSKEGPLMGSKIYVGGLPYSATDQQLQELFSPHGSVASAKVITDKFTGQSRGFGFEIGRASCRERV